MAGSQSERTSVTMYTFVFRNLLKSYIQVIKRNACAYFRQLIGTYILLHVSLELGFTNAINTWTMRRVYRLERARTHHAGMQVPTVAPAYQVLCWFCLKKIDHISGSTSKAVSSSNLQYGSYWVQPKSDTTHYTAEKTSYSPGPSVQRIGQTSSYARLSRPSHLHSFPPSLLPSFRPSLTYVCPGLPMSIHPSLGTVGWRSARTHACAWWRCPGAGSSQTHNKWAALIVVGKFRLYFCITLNARNCQ